jgi:hypothetical protein
LLRDRKENDGFPKNEGVEAAGNGIRYPDRFLGHSDTTDRKETVGDGPVTVTNNGDADAAVAVDDSDSIPK